jgi:hypothetical protein
MSHKYKNEGKEMTDALNDRLNDRVISAIEVAIKEGKIQSWRNLAIVNGMVPQSLNEVKQGRRNVHLNLLIYLVREKGFNPYYILGTSKVMFTGKKTANV